MIIKAEIINQPYSGEYLERIYDHESSWNSQSWTFVKFTNNDSSEWCGQFRGFPKQVGVSNVHRTVLVLTSDYLFQLNIESGDVLAFEDQTVYENLTVAPDGSYIVADYYNLQKITTDIRHATIIESPIKMDMIAFKNWEDRKLNFTCDEFLNWENHLLLTYDYINENIDFSIRT